MNKSGYKKAKDKLGMKNPDIWCSYFKIARDTDKSYSSGRLPIPERISKNVLELVKNRQERVLKLKQKLTNVFPSAVINLCGSTNDITLNFEEYDKKILFKNNGKDHFLHDVYSFIGPGKINHLILFYPEKPWVKDASQTNFDWFYWRSEPSQQIGMKNYHNKITKSLLGELLGVDV